MEIKIKVMFACMLILMAILLFGAVKSSNAEVPATFQEQQQCLEACASYGADILDMHVEQNRALLTVGDLTEKCVGVFTICLEECVPVDAWPPMDDLEKSCRNTAAYVLGEEVH